MVSCNMYAEKNETIELGRAGLRALEKSGKKVIAVLVSGLSNRFFIKEIEAKDDRISSAKDDEWNRKITELLADGRLEDVAQVARDFGREANGDMGFKGIWWLNGLCGESNDFTGKVLAYDAIYGTGNCIAVLEPKSPVRSRFTPEPAAANGSAKQEKSSAGSSGTKVISSSTAPEPVGAYPHARREGDLLFLSGVGPRQKGSKKIPGVDLDAEGNITSYDVETQTRSVIQNITTILEEAGSSLEKVIDVQVYLTNMKNDFPIFNRVYAEFFKDIQATRTTIEVGALPTPIAVEFKVVARP